MKKLMLVKIKGIAMLNIWWCVMEVTNTVMTTTTIPWYSGNEVECQNEK